MVPIAEMARHPKFIEDIIYLYDPSLNKKERKREYIENVIHEVISKKPYEKVVYD